MLISEYIQITNENNMDLMKRYPDNYFDLAIVDPPYGINAPNLPMGSTPNRTGPGKYPAISTADRLKKGRLNTGSGHMKNSVLVNSDLSWDIVPDKSYFDELFRVSKNQIIWGGNYFNLPPTRGIAIWDKRQPWDNFSQVELAWTSFDIPAKLFSMSNTGGKNHIKKIHPTQKPVELYKWLLTKYAKEGDKILDTHLGSGSIAIACYDYGYELIGCELNQGYYNDTIERCRVHFSNNQNLFEKANY